MMYLCIFHTWFFNAFANTFAPSICSPTLENVEEIMSIKTSQFTLPNFIRLTRNSNYCQQEMNGSNKEEDFLNFVYTTRFIIKSVELIY